MKKIMAVLIFAVAVFSLMSSGLRAETRKYIKIGGDPHPAVAGKVFEGEKIFPLPEDLEVLTVGGSGREYTGWLRANEELVIKGNRVVRIKRCGNPIYYPNGDPIRVENLQAKSFRDEDMYEYVQVPSQRPVEVSRSYYDYDGRELYQPQTRQARVVQRTTGETVQSYIRTGSKAYAAGEAFKKDSPGSGVAWGLSAVEDLREGGDLWQTLFTVGLGILGNNNTSKPRNNNYYYSYPFSGGLPPF